jgi:hypothetical protein
VLGLLQEQGVLTGERLAFRLPGHDRIVIGGLDTTPDDLRGPRPGLARTLFNLRQAGTSVV